MEERTNQMSYKDVVQTALAPTEQKKPYNPHEFWRSQENKLHFELVRKDIILGLLPKTLTPDVIKNEGNFHRNEIYIIKNFEKLNEEYEKNELIRGLQQKIEFA